MSVTKPRAVAAVFIWLLAAGGLTPSAAPAGPAEPVGTINMGGTGSGPHCKSGGIVFNKWITINKPVTITKNIDIWKNIEINNDVNIQKNIWINKSININKTININKGSVNVDVSASASANAAAIVYGGGYASEVTVNKGGEAIAGGQATEPCEYQQATVVKAIHAVCVAPDGREFPASHMLPETWIDSSYEGEIARCIPGAYVKAVIGDVVQSDQGMAGTYEHGQSLVCSEHQALRHYKDGMLKCESVVPVKDCTERTNLRKYGTGDMFFSFRSRVCATAVRDARARPLDLSGMSLEGGVGPGY